MKIRERNIAMKNKMQVMMWVNCDDGQAHNEEIEIKKRNANRFIEKKMKI